MSFNADEINDIKKKLSEFVDEVKMFKETDFNEKTKAHIYRGYKEIYSLYSDLSELDVKSNFSSDEIKILDILKLGEKNESDFDELISQIKQNSCQTAINVANFIKTRKGFDLINKNSDFSEFTDDELVSLFGSLFGVQVAQSCVKSLRAERVGRVVGYALSGLCEEHIREFNSLTSPNKDFVSFLKRKIQESDVEAVYFFEESGSKVSVTCGVNENKNASLTEVRGRNRPDHCFINHKTKTIVLGLSTSDKDIDNQGYTFSKAFLAFKEMVKHGDATTNPYYNYKLEPFYFLGGRFVADDANVTQQKGRDFLKMLDNISLTEKQTLAQMQYFRLYGNAPSKDIVNTLPYFNPFIAGCNTEDIYFWQQELIGKTDDPSVINKECFAKICSYLTGVVDVFSEHKLFFNENGKGDVLLYLKDIHKICKNIFINFNNEISDDEYDEFVKPLYNSIIKLNDNIKNDTGLFANEVLNDLMDVAEKLEDVDTFNKKIKRTQTIQNLEVEWHNFEKPKFTAKDKDDLKVFAKIALVLSEKTHFGKNFLEKYADVLREVILYRENPTKVKEDYFGTTANFASSASYAIKSIKEFSKQTLVADFIQKSKFLVKRPMDSDYADSDIFKKQLDELLDFTNNILVDKFYEVAEMPEIKKENRLKIGNK